MNEQFLAIIYKGKICLMQDRWLILRSG